MEDTKTKAEVMKPILVKAGIPLAVSVAGFIFSRFVTRRSSSPKPLEPEEPQLVTHEESFLSFDSTSFPHLENEECISAITHFTNPLAMFPSFDRRDMGEEVLGLRKQIEELQDREWKLERRFLEYCNVKDRELVLRELESGLLLEMARVEFLDKEVSSLEAENRRFEELVVGFLDTLEQLHVSRKENGLLQRKVKKLWRKTRGLCRVVSEKEREISIKETELERKCSVVNSMETQITELQTTMEKLQVEKNELFDKLDLAEKAASQKVEENGIREDEYNHLVNELKQLQKDQSAEFNELIYLRWSNACLRHQLMSRNVEHVETKMEEMFENNQDLVNGDHLEIEFKGIAETEGSMQEQNLNDLADHRHSRRQKLVKKLKKWVDGSEKTKHEAKCLRRSLASVGTDEEYLPPRKSYSSV